VDTRPIGVFDSGAGGLTVLHECLVTLPHEDFVYLGDGARLPYGPRPLDEIRRFAGEIAAYLERHAAETWDSKAANRFAAVSAADPTRITATPGWQRMHHAIDPALFRSHAVGSRANCAACHRDADGGRFDPQAISLPEGKSS